ncbi:hypothetical protein [[Mycoplasma] gypis]|uniref:Uncharacterized protein n=1 Tax=[Mycoplasma] gypis TaxID=92404 RepID=A0ABZ2RNM9_9BACT|nr:hypothetical protein [[Mycoplasma] gypis]MBN0919422.1 hypothetical protein [[Mycoplasma] gypis]
MQGKSNEERKNKNELIILIKEKLQNILILKNDLISQNLENIAQDLNTNINEQDLDNFDELKLKINF